MNNSNLCLMVMEARKSKIKVPRVPMFDENLFSGSYMAIFSLVPSQGGKKAPGRGDGWASFIRALIPFMGALPARPHDLPKAPSPNTTHHTGR